MDGGAWWAQSMGLQRIRYDRAHTQGYDRKSYGPIKDNLFEIPLSTP